MGLGLRLGLGLRSLPLTMITVPPCVGPPVGATSAAMGGAK